MKFTDREIRALKATEKRYEVFADNSRGFGIRVSPSGARSWISVYRRNGKLTRLTLGRHPATSLQEALERHDAQRRLLSRGLDPRESKRRAEERLQESERSAAIGTVEALASEYVERHAKPTKLSWREDARMLGKDVLPHWRGRQARDIKPRDVVELLDRVIDRGSPVTANRTLALLSRLFGFGVDHGLLDASPVMGLKRPSQEAPRRRNLSNCEVRSFWHALPQTKIPLPQQLALKLLLVTGQRRGELTKSKVAHFNVDTATWTIPPELINKKKRDDVSPHEVPLSSLALELVRELLTINGGSIWTLPSPRTDSHVDERTLTRSLAKSLDCFDIDKSFVVHDLRRSVTTRLGELGVPHHVKQKILNHEAGNITPRVYDRHDYYPEKKQALDTWAQHLKEILDG